MKQAADAKYTVESNARVADGVFLLKVKTDEPLAEPAAPGMFAMIKVSDGAVPLLRRPLSYLDCGKKRASFLYRVVGGGTKILSEVGKGRAINILGPLGNGFDITTPPRRVALVAGGMGLPPMRFLAEKLASIEGVRVDLYYGAASSEMVIFEEKLKKLAKLHIATDDGSRGKKGLVTDLLAPALEGDKAPGAIYACGPSAMLKAVHKLAVAKNIPCQVSLEARMACGTGVCLGCAVETTDASYLKVCDDGPVFDSRVVFGVD